MFELDRVIRDVLRHDKTIANNTQLAKACNQRIDGGVKKKFTSKDIGEQLKKTDGVVKGRYFYSLANYHKMLPYTYTSMSTTKRKPIIYNPHDVIKMISRYTTGTTSKVRAYDKVYEIEKSDTFYNTVKLNLNFYDFEPIVTKN